MVRRPGFTQHRRAPELHMHSYYVVKRAPSVRPRVLLPLFFPPEKKEGCLALPLKFQRDASTHTSTPGTLMSKRCCRLSIFYSFHEEKRNIGRRFYAARLLSLRVRLPTCTARRPPDRPYCISGS